MKLSKDSGEIFFIVGGQRCGTTFLANILDNHENIQLAKPIFPEPKYFLKRPQNINLSDYFERYFQDNDKGKIFVEKSTSYYEHENAAKNIKHFLPQAKIIFILRNPVYRSISNYFFTKDHGLETRSLEDVFIKRLPHPKYPKNISTNPFDYVKRGEYINFINLYKNYFKRENIIVLVLEKIIRDTGELEPLFKFLGTDIPKLDKVDVSKINAGDYSKISISKKVMRALYRHFEDYNRRLELELSVNLEIWKI